MKCEECNKKLGLLEGYNHPTMGKKHPVCGSCFDKVNTSVNEWREFIEDAMKPVPRETIPDITVPEVFPVLEKPTIVANGLNKWLR